MKPSLVSLPYLPAHLGTKAGGYPVDSGRVTLQRGHTQTPNHLTDILVERDDWCLVKTSVETLAV